MSENQTVIEEDNNSVSELKVTKAMEFLISEVCKKTSTKEKPPKSEKPKKIKVEKPILNLCKGKSKKNKDCTRKETENCNGFCKQHFKLEKEKAITIELIEKHKKL